MCKHPEKTRAASWTLRYLKRTERYDFSVNMKYQYRNRGDLSIELMCLFCSDIYQEPSILPCKHTFCYDCLQRWVREKTSCPLCRRKFKVSQIKPDRSKQAQLQDFDVYCSYPGCWWSGSQQNLREHVKECNHKLHSVPGRSSESIQESHLKMQRLDCESQVLESFRVAFVED